MENNEKKNWKQIENLKVLVKDLNHSYMHGMVYGLDCPGEGMIVHTDTDITRYHAIVIDKIKRGEGTLVDALRGKQLDWVVERLSTDDPNKMLEFFYKYNKKDESGS